MEPVNHNYNYNNHYNTHSNYDYNCASLQQQCFHQGVSRLLSPAQVYEGCFQRKGCFGLSMSKPPIKV